MNKKTIKYNASEVHITRSVVALFIYMAMLASVWLVRRMHRDMSSLLYVFAGLFLVLTAVTAVVAHLQKKGGADLSTRVWGMDYWLYLSVSGLSAHALLVISHTMDLWTYMVPMVYVMLILHYVLYVSAIDQGRNFCWFGFLSAAAGLGMMGNYQTYYNTAQQIISTQFFPQKTAFTVGWVIIGLAAAVIAYFGWRKKISCWKQLGTVAIFAAYWGVLQMKWGTGFLVTLIGAGVLALWYITLRILRQIKVIG